MAALDGSYQNLGLCKDYYLSYLQVHFDSKLCLMVLIWEISGETVPRNLEIDMRGDATVETAVVSASHDIAPPTSSEIPRDLEVSDGKATATCWRMLIMEEDLSQPRESR